MWSSDQRRREANSLNRQCKLRRSLAYRWLPQAPTVPPSLWLARPSRSDHCAAPLQASVKGCTISAYVAGSLRQVRSPVTPANCRFVSSNQKIFCLAAPCWVLPRNSGIDDLYVRDDTYYNVMTGKVRCTSNRTRRRTAKISTSTALPLDWRRRCS